MCICVYICIHVYGVYIYIYIDTSIYIYIYIGIVILGGHKPTQRWDYTCKSNRLSSACCKEIGCLSLAISCKPKLVSLNDYGYSLQGGAVGGGCSGLG